MASAVPMGLGPSWVSDGQLQLSRLTQSRWSPAPQQPAKRRESFIYYFFGFCLNQVETNFFPPTCILFPTQLAGGALDPAALHRSDLLFLAFFNINTPRGSKPLKRCKGSPHLLAPLPYGLCQCRLPGPHLAPGKPASGLAKVSQSHDMRGTQPAFPTVTSFHREILIGPGGKTPSEQTHLPTESLSLGN